MFTYMDIHLHVHLNSFIPLQFSLWMLVCITDLWITWIEFDETLLLSLESCIIDTNALLFSCISSAFQLHFLQSCIKCSQAVFMVGKEFFLQLQPVLLSTIFSGSVRNTENTSPVCPEQFVDVMCLHLSVSAMSVAVSD